MSEIKKKTVLSPEEVTEDKKKYTRKISTPIYEPKKNVQFYRTFTLLLKEMN